MASYWYEETYDPSGGNQAQTSIRGGQRIVQTFDCHTDDPQATGANVLGALAAYVDVFKGCQHYLYPFAYCTDIAAVRDPADPAFRWLVTATYEEPAPVPGGPILGVGVDGVTPETTPSGTTGGGANQPQPQPWNRAPLPKVTFRRVNEYRLQDLDTEFFVNGAGDPFDPPPAIPATEMKVTFVTYKEFWNVTIGQSFFNKVNLTTWQGFPAGTCVVEGLDAQMKTEAGITFWELHWEIGAYGWDKDMTRILVPNFGWNFINDDEEKVPAKSVYGEQLASPVALEYGGGLRDPAEGPVSISFRIRDEVEFNPVGGVGGL